MAEVSSPLGGSSRASSGRFARPVPAFELLESKLRPPHGRAGTVPRSQLIDLLEPESGAVPVVFVSAGPGWGKTTLLTQWAARSQRPFAWVSVDANDNDPIVLLTYVATALERVARLDSSVFEALTSPGASIEGTVVPRLGMALATMDEAVVLVFDDLHLLDSQPCLDAIAALARHVPAGSQLVLSARGQPALPLGALRARGLALEIGPDELRMDETEAHQLLSAAGLDLTDHEVAELTEHTEGWSAGLYLAALSANASGAGVTSVTEFRGDDRFVADYLLSELLSRLPREELRFLTRTAVLEPMSGPLCDATLEESDSAAVLESLARSNLFLVPLDRTGEWYRYHHLFRELLHSELRRVEPDLVPQLLARAADWCEANGQPEAAIGYAQAAGDVDRTARLVARSALPTYQGGRAATVERWIGWLDAQGAIERDASVAVLAALVAALGAGRRRRSVGPMRPNAQAMTAPCPMAPPRSTRGWPSCVRCNAVEGPRGCAQMRSSRSRRSPVGARSGRTPCCCTRFRCGWRARSTRPTTCSPTSPRRASSWQRPTRSQWLWASVPRSRSVEGRGCRQRSSRTGRSGSSASHAWRSTRPARSPIPWPARVAVHRGDARGAQELLTRAQRLRPGLTYALPYFAVQTRLELARAFLALADAGGAATMLRETEAVLRRRPDLGALPAQVEALRDSLKTMHAQAPGASTLTEAELRLLPHLATHLSFRELGERLYLSRHTVKSHAMAIYRKLNVSSRNAAVERARELGLL